METVFFGEHGITSTSANHIANIAKEEVEKINIDFDNINFIDKEVSFVMSTNATPYKTSFGIKNLDCINQNIAKVQKAYGLIAWLREAIKCKEKMLYELNDLTIIDYCYQSGKIMPVAPEGARSITFNEQLEKLSIGERVKYYELNSNAAVIGTLIHPKGSFSKARKNYAEILNNPTQILGSGQDAQVWKYTPSLPEKEISDTFFALQSLHRKIEAELNGIKAKVQKEVDDINLKAKEEYKISYDNFSSSIYSLQNEFDIWKDKERTRISDLKIIIPNILQETFDYYNNL